MSTLPDWYHPLCDGCHNRHDPSTPCPDGTTWFKGAVVCRVCGHESLSVQPVPPGMPFPPRDAECPRCHAFAADAKED